jgi:histidine triad (HIT) family protein
VGRATVRYSYPMDQCVFCQIAKREIPATFLFENDDFLAFSPIESVAQGHTLLVPRQHYVNIFDIDPDTFVALSALTRTLSVNLAETHGATGINLLHASGKDAQQSVFHFHMHLVPRYKDDGLDLWFRNKL